MIAYRGSEGPAGYPMALDMTYTRVDRHRPVPAHAESGPQWRKWRREVKTIAAPAASTASTTS